MLYSKPQKAFHVVNIVFMIVLSLCFVLPYVMILSASLTDEMTLLASGGMTLFPKKFSFYAYEYIFSSNTLMLRSILNSLIMTVTGTALSTVVCMMCAYPLSRKYLKHRKGIMFFILFTMLFSGGLVPTYLLVSTVFPDSMLAVIVPTAMSAWYTILIKNFFLSVSPFIEEAAKMDGASNFCVFWRIFLPISKPILATVILFNAVSIWNNWFSPKLYITTQEKYPIQYLLQQLLVNVEGIYGGGGGNVVPQESVKMASVIVASLPLILVYPFLQKYFINGIMLGGVKE